MSPRSITTAVGTSSTEKGEDVVDYMKKKYGERKISEEICSF